MRWSGLSSYQYRQSARDYNRVLFLDELPEFNRTTLEVLRQPLEDGTVTISRALNSTTFPANFMLIAALNPCPCGYRTDPRRECHCTPPAIERYMSRISGPLPTFPYTREMPRFPGKVDTFCRSAWAPTIA